MIPRISAQKGSSSMKFNVAGIISEGNGSVKAYDVDEEVKGGRHINGNVRMLRTDRGLWVSARMDYVIRETCDRCLNDATKRLEMSIEEEFFMADDLGPSDCGDPEGINTVIDQHNILDLSQAIEHHIIINQPIQFTCSTDCKGLCSLCGTNLNQNICKCVNEPLNTQWEDLKGII
jgi:uncharacterized protein